MHCHFCITDEILRVQKRPDDLVTKKGPPGAGFVLQFRAEQHLECSTWEAFAMVAHVVLPSFSVERGEKT